MKRTIYFVTRNGMPLLGTARETQEQASSLCKKLKSQYDVGEYGIDHLDTWWGPEMWNQQLMSHYMSQKLLFGK